MKPTKRPKKSGSWGSRRKGRAAAKGITKDAETAQAEIREEEGNEGLTSKGPQKSQGRDGDVEGNRDRSRFPLPGEPEEEGTPTHSDGEEEDNREETGGMESRKRFPSPEAVREEKRRKPAEPGLQEALEKLDDCLKKVVLYCQQGNTYRPLKRIAEILPTVYEQVTCTLRTEMSLRQPTTPECPSCSAATELAEEERAVQAIEEDLATVSSQEELEALLQKQWPSSLMSGLFTQDISDFGS